MFRSVILTLIVLVLAAAAAPARAADAPKPEIPSFFQMLQGQPEIPEDWMGIWDIEIMSGLCGFPLGNTISETDTLCAGETLDPPETEEEVDFDCSGTIDGSSVDMTCTGTVEVFEGCVATFNVDFDGTLTADSYTITTEVTTSYTGTGVECQSIPAGCFRSQTTGTRTGPVPAGFCQTPVLPTTWSSIKVEFR